MIKLLIIFIINFLTIIIINNNKNINKNINSNNNINNCNNNKYYSKHIWYSRSQESYS
jgi:hypothetical protein